MLKKVLLGIAATLAAVVAIFLIVVAMQPADFTITRSATMAAAPEKVFEQVNDFHKWQAWSPWAKMDPDAKNSYEGPSSGEGAVFRWSGNSDVGSGSMMITDSRPHERIAMRLDFLEPMEDTCDTVFTFVRNGEQTTMTWTMTGQYSFLAKAMCLFMDMDEMVGGQFEKGLESIKAIVESKTVQPAESAEGQE